MHSVQIDYNLWLMISSVVLLVWVYALWLCKRWMLIFLFAVYLVSLIFLYSMPRDFFPTSIIQPGVAISIYISVRSVDHMEIGLFPKTVAPILMN